MSIAHFTLSVRRRQRIVAASFPELTLVQVHAGTKRVSHDGTQTDTPAMHFLAVSPGICLSFENMPPSQGPYVAHCMSIGTPLLQELAAVVRQDTQRFASLAPTPALLQAWAHTRAGLHDKLPESILRHRLRELLEALALAGFVPSLPEHVSTAERVRALVATEPARTWQAGQVADHLAVSTATLRRHLAREGTSFRAVLEEMRLGYALVLVQSSTQPLKQVAAACGYTSPSRFSARFRARFGVSPSALRA